MADSKKKRPGLKPSVQAAIDKRRMELRGGRSIREVSRSQKDLDERFDEWRTIRNRMSWCRNPLESPNRMLGVKMKEAGVSMDGAIS